MVEQWLGDRIDCGVLTVVRELQCVATSGDQFVDFVGPNIRETIDEVNPTDLLQFVNSADLQQTNFLCHLRSLGTPGRSVWVARARHWWWVSHGRGAVITAAAMPDAQPEDWLCYEMPEPFWGDWLVLPFWAATTRDGAIDDAWRALTADAPSGAAKRVHAAIRELPAAARHRRAIERGAALLSDWDDLEQTFPAGE